MVHIPPKPKNDREFFEVMSRIIFISGFNWKVVNERWPKIRKAFHNFDISKISSENVDNLIKKEGMIKNRSKISAIIENAKICRELIKKHGSLMEWVKDVERDHDKNPLFNPAVRDEMKRFQKISNTTSRWMAYVTTRDKSLLEK